MPRRREAEAIRGQVGSLGRSRLQRVRVLARAERCAPLFDTCCSGLLRRWGTVGTILAAPALRPFVHQLLALLGWNLRQDLADGLVRDRAHAIHRQLELM